MARTTALPTSVEALQAMVIEQEAVLARRAAELEAKQSKIDEQAAHIALLEEWKRLITSQRFAPKSEKLPAEQGWLFNEAEVEAERAGAEDEAPEIIVPEHARRRGGRRPLPSHLPVREVLHDLPEDEKTCPHDPRHTLSEIGRETSDQLQFIPARVEVVRHVRPKYACPRCKEGVRIAPMPKLPVPKSIATPSLLAQVATTKYVDGVPLYRQEKIFARLGVDLSRATLAHWMVKMGELVEPLTRRIHAAILEGALVQSDETPFQVLKEPGKRAESQSYLWALRGGTRDHPLIFYEYDPSRSREVPKRLLRGFEGFLQTDGYEGYTAIGQEPGIVHVGCWAHTRRKFDEALRGQPRKKGKGAKQPAKVSKARQALAMIQELYRLERRWKEASPDERLAGRLEASRPVVEKIRAWLDTSIESVPPQTLTGKAMSYTHRQWPKLVRFLDDGRIPLDTNAVENAIRPFVLGRKNWLFADTTAGATASARLYGLIETAKANGIEPWAYLNRVFEVLPTATTEGEIEALLPQNLDPAELTRG